MVPLYTVRRRLHEIDPAKPMEDVNRFLLNALSVYNDEGEDDDDGEGTPKANTIHLNSEIDCERLAQVSKRVFAKRYGQAPRAVATPSTPLTLGMTGATASNDAASAALEGATVGIFEAVVPVTDDTTAGNTRPTTAATAAAVDASFSASAVQPPVARSAEATPSPRATPQRKHPGPKA
jgi:hypothetical protein